MYFFCKNVDVNVSKIKIIVKYMYYFKLFDSKYSKLLRYKIFFMLFIMYNIIFVFYNE